MNIDIKNIEIDKINWTKDYLLEHQEATERTSLPISVHIGEQQWSTHIHVVPPGYHSSSQKSSSECISFWQSRNDAELYLMGRAWRRSELLLNIFEHLHIDRNSKIIEIGCGIGRNLLQLSLQGYQQLTGYDITLPRNPFQLIIDRLLIEYPEEPKFEECDVIFTMACLQHIHPDIREKYIAEMARQAKTIITIEDETSIGLYAYPPRDVPDLFKKHGMDCVESLDLDTNEWDLKGYKIRVYK